MYLLYRTATCLMGPLLPLLLRRRLSRGKEDPARIRERLGNAPQPRPEGKLLWIHAASMGEAASVLPLIERFLNRHAGWHILVTSVTVTSAALLAQKLPARAFHQYAPLDNPAVVSRFLKQWNPQAALWVESELWPNMMIEMKRAGVPLILANARISERSCRRWQKAPKLIASLLQCFAAIYPQSRADTERFRLLGAQNPEMLGNLKYDTPPLPVEETALQTLKKQIGNRLVWLAASTHAGEEELVLATHRRMKQDYPELLTIIVPRHAPRGTEIAAMLQGQDGQSALRSESGIISPETEFYIADTMGELGLFYRLASVALIGGSLVPHGGQNMLEPLRLGVSVITGPHTHNFAAIMEELKAANAVITVESPEELAGKALYLLQNEPARVALQQGAGTVLSQHGGSLEKLLERLEVFCASA